MLYVRRITEPGDVVRPFSEQILVSEEACLRITRTGFALSYLPSSSPEWRVFPAKRDEAAVLGDPEAALFGAYSDNTCVGIASARVEDTGWTVLEDIRVEAKHRREGAGRLLLESCVSFGRSRGMLGIRAETTDTNPVMCQFLEHCGFQVGGMDKMRRILTAGEREKPMMKRACLLMFYRGEGK